MPSGYNGGDIPARDNIHAAVRNALVKDGWTVTHDPLRLRFEQQDLYVDLGAERLLGAEKGTRKIAVEIKTFLSPSEMADLQQAAGQFALYRLVLERIEPERELYLAVPQDVAGRVFRRTVGRLFVESRQIKVIGVNIESEEVAEWIL